MEVKEAEGIVQIIYTSIATTAFTKEQLRDLLIKARRNNHSLRISGMLVYDDGFFIQVLEGPESRVDSLFSHINKDRRHRNMRLLLRQSINTKEYAEWSMGFVDSSALPAQIAGFVPYGKLRQTIQDTTRAKQLIRMFQEGQWRRVVSR